MLAYWQGKRRRVPNRCTQRRLHCDGDLSLVALLLFRLESQAMYCELLAHGPILLQHDLLILFQSVEFMLGLNRRLGEDLLEVDPCLFTRL